MRRIGSPWLFVVTLAALGVGGVPLSGPAGDGALPVADARALSASEVLARWHGRLDRRHFTAEVHMAMKLAGLSEERDIRVFREDDGGRGERVMIRFEAPADLRGVGLLYLENANRPNDYFFYQPKTRRVRRLPASIADDDVYGVDLEFLGFGVAQSEPAEVVSMETVDLDGAPTYLITERATREDARFELRRTWIDAETFLPMRTEHIEGGKIVLIAETQAVESIQGVSTPRRVRFTKPIENRDVLLEVTDVDYEAEIPAEFFSVVALAKKRLND